MNTQLLVTDNKNDDTLYLDTFENKDNSWLEIHNLGPNQYNMGFWDFSIVRVSNQQYIDFNGVSKIRLFEILSVNGFCKLFRENGTFILIHNNDNVLSVVNGIQIKDFALKLLDLLPDEIDILGFKIKTDVLKEKFLDEHVNLFREESLSPLKNLETPILRDTANTMYFPFLNGVAVVTQDGAIMRNYTELDNLCVWKDHIIKRNVELVKSTSMFELFIKNVSNQNVEQIKAKQAAIGYLLHRYYNEVNTKAVILYDEELTDSNSANGGTGKGLFAKSLSKLRRLETIDGKKFNSTDKFGFQRINELTDLVFFDDIRPEFEFERFNSILTDGWEVEAKNKKTIRIALNQSPKMIIASNSIMKTKDGFTAERRQYIIEFSNFYSKLKEISQEPVVHVHGCQFFYDWDEIEWNRFYSYMIYSCVQYLKSGLPLVKTINVQLNRLLQDTSKDFVDWVNNQCFEVGKRYLYSEYYQDFTTKYSDSSTFSIQNFSKWLKLYAKMNRFDYKTKRYNDKTYFSF